MNNKKLWITLLIIFLVLFLVFGLLYGWFRKKKGLTQEDINELKKITKNNTREQIQTLPEKDFFELWMDHVRLTRAVILAEFNNSSDLNYLVSTLMKNQEEIGNKINTYYPGSSDIVTKLLKEHISQAKDILDDLKYKRFNRLFSDINKWFNNADEFSEVIEKINPKWKLKSHMREHLIITEREGVYEWLGANNMSASIYKDRIVPNAKEMADIFANNI